MENFEYYKAFPSNTEGTGELTPGEKETMKILLEKYEGELRDKPRVILPFAPAVFEKTVAACERVAEEFSGSIRATIDYSYFAAAIELRCCYVEFMRGEFMGILHELSRLALSIRFTPLTSGDLHVEIRMPYFAAAQKSLE